MSEYIKKIRTKSGDKQIDYNALGNLPVSDTTLTLEGSFADAKVVGDEISKLSEEKIALPKDSDGNILSGSAGQFAISDGNGGITWLSIADAEEVSF